MVPYGNDRGETIMRTGLRPVLRTAVALIGASALIAVAGCTTDPTVEPGGGEGGGED